MSKKSRKLWTATAALALCGCASSPDLPPPEPLADFSPTRAIAVLWEAQTGGGKFYLTPDIRTNSLCAAAANGSLIRLRLDDGEILSQARVRSEVAAGVGCDAEFFVVAGPDSVLRVVGEDGEEAWSAQLTGSILGAPAVSGARLFALGGDGRISAFPLRRGELLWRYSPTASPRFRIRADSQVIAEAGALYAGLPGGQVVAVRADSGEELWSTPLAEPSGDSEISAIADVTAPVIVGDAVCASSYQGRIGCLLKDGGRVLWLREFSSLLRVAADSQSGRLFAIDGEGALHSFGLLDGAAGWRQMQTKNRMPSAPAAAGGFALVGDGEGFIHAFNSSDGAAVARINLDASAIIFIAALGDSDSPRFIAQTSRGGIFMVELRALDS